MDKAALLAKTALARPVDTRNSDPFYSGMEKECLERINALGIGPQGFGGINTALAVNIEVFPTHIAGLPLRRQYGVPRQPPRQLCPVMCLTFRCAENSIFRRFFTISIKMTMQILLYVL